MNFDLDPVFPEMVNDLSLLRARFDIEMVYSCQWRVMLVYTKPTKHKTKAMQLHSVYTKKGNIYETE